VDGLRRSPGFASEEASQQLAVGNWLKLPDSAGGLPGIRPSDRCGFLAYSCAAARELHPLPCLCHGAKTRKPKDISKNGKYRCQEFTGERRWKSTVRRVWREGQLPNGTSRARDSLYPFESSPVLSSHFSPGDFSPIIRVYCAQLNIFFVRIPSSSTGMKAEKPTHNARIGSSLGNL
jgi:hypothetical protein